MSLFSLGLFCKRVPHWCQTCQDGFECCSRVLRRMSLFCPVPWVQLPLTVLHFYHLRLRMSSASKLVSKTTIIFCVACKDLEVVTCHLEFTVQNARLASQAHNLLKCWADQFRCSDFLLKAHSKRPKWWIYLWKAPWTMWPWQNVFFFLLKGWLIMALNRVLNAFQEEYCFHWKSFPALGWDCIWHIQPQFRPRAECCGRTLKWGTFSHQFPRKLSFIESKTSFCSYDIWKFIEMHQSVGSVSWG